MYVLKTSYSFDAAHFLHGYEGKCRNIHGHRWTVEVEVMSEKLQECGPERGMYVDFGTLKNDVKNLLDTYDHSFIYEKDSLKESTIAALKDEEFYLVEVGFRPTAENFSEYFYHKFMEMGYEMKAVTVYETPNNSASYME